MVIKPKRSFTWNTAPKYEIWNNVRDWFENIYGLDCTVTLCIFVNRKITVLFTKLEIQWRFCYIKVVQCIREAVASAFADVVTRDPKRHF